MTPNFDVIMTHTLWIEHLMPWFMQERMEVLEQLAVESDETNFTKLQCKAEIFKKLIETPEMMVQSNMSNRITKSNMTILGGNTDDTR